VLEDTFQVLRRRVRYEINNIVQTIAKGVEVKKARARYMRETANLAKPSQGTRRTHGVSNGTWSVRLLRGGDGSQTNIRTKQICEHCNAGQDQKPSRKCVQVKYGRY